MSTSAQISPLLGNQTLAKLERLRLKPLRNLTARGRGEHLARKGGSSTDFADYRDYAAGDDLRFVDWNAFARLRRPYLKTFRIEEERHLLILVDASRSMAFEGKMALAKRLAAAFTVCGLFGGERVSVHAPGAGELVVPPCRGRQALRRALAAVAAIPDDCAGQPFTRAVDVALSRHSGRGYAVILSDFLADEDLRVPLNRLFSAGLELLAVQVLSPAELDPELDGDVRLVDSESGGALDVTGAGDLMALYHDHRARWTAMVDDLCRGRGGRFVQASSREPLETLLFERLRRAGWLA